MRTVIKLRDMAKLSLFVEGVYSIFLLLGSNAVLNKLEVIDTKRKGALMD